MYKYTWLNAQLSIRQTRQQLNEIETVLDSIPEQNRPNSARELFEFLFSYYRKHTENPTATITETTAAPAAPVITPEEVETLKKELEIAKEQIQAYDVAMIKMLRDPLHLLTEKEYANLKAWDENELTPALQRIFQSPDLQITGQQKFALMFDYCKADPVSEILTILPALTDEQKEAVENLRFPRAAALQELYNQLNPTHEPEVLEEKATAVTVDTTEKTEQPVTGATEQQQ